MGRHKDQAFLGGRFVIHEVVAGRGANGDLGRAVTES